MAYQPKSYKKFVATAATATLVASAVVPVAFAAKPASEFTDVAPQYKVAVDYLVDNTIAAGKTPTTFGTAENIIRVDAAIWIAKATMDNGEISDAPASNFTDVPDRGKIYVDALKFKGYVNGSTATAFNSYANISRGEVAMILAEAYDITGNTADNKFTDVNARYLAAVSALKDNGITTGKTTTRFGTNDAITRGELAIWIHRLELLGTDEATVASATALNAKQIEVRFDTTLNADAATVNDATELDNYSFSGVAPISAVLSTDKKSVVLTFATSIEGPNNLLVVEPIVTESKDGEGNVIVTEKYSQVFNYTDAVKPVITSSSYANGKVTLNFSENLSQLPTAVRVNGTPVTAVAFAAGSTSKVEVTVALPAGSSASLFVAGAEDASTATNEMDIFNGTVTAPGADTEKPRVASVVVTGQNTAKVTLSEDIVAETISATLQQGSTQTPVTLVRDTTDESGKTYSLTVAGLFTGTSTSETFTMYIAADAMSDLANPANKNDFYSTTVTFNRDTVAPTLASTQVAANNQKLEFTFNEALTVAGNDANIIVTNSEGVRITAIDNETFLKTTDNKTYQVDVKAGDVALDAGTYTVSIPAEFFTDAFGNKTTAVSGTFTVGTATSTDTVKPTAAVTTTAKNQFTVAYSEEVTGSGVALSNYRLDGQALPVGTDIYFTSAAKNQVVIQLPTNSVNIGNQTTGASAILTVSGVADKAGNSITTANYGVVVKDNTAATASNVQVIGQDVYVTFTENVTVPALTDSDTVFNLTVNGTTVTGGLLETVAGAANRVKFTLDAAPTATPVVTVKANQTVVTDTNGTPVK
ncbi:S-layer homology domain-containing protein [Paenisporosarcina macmurdoensis]|uniref:S-layer homology domain-containing protein n=1 Tax=Paenisporosarcina macmurdoensis TaxID=212659 RepID=A0ABW1L492_9BACL